MTNLVPGATWDPIDQTGFPKRRKGRGLVGHVAVSTAHELRPSGGNSWHFYLPKIGPAFQFIDLDLQCGATLNGNASLAAFESEGGMGTAAQVNAEPWNDNQLNWAARILRHMHDTEGVPYRVMESSLPSEQGFGTHRLGINPWRVAGGELWSSHDGKLCPGDAKHAQRAEVVRRAQTAQEDDMSVKAEDQINQIWEWIRDKDNAGAVNMLQAILFGQRALTAMLKGSHTDGADRLTDLWTAVLAIKDPSQPSDPAAVAAALAALLPKDIAQQVADELAARLARP